MRRYNGKPYFTYDIVRNIYICLYNIRVNANIRRFEACALYQFCQYNLVLSQWQLLRYEGSISHIVAFRLEITTCLRLQLAAGYVLQLTSYYPGQFSSCVSKHGFLRAS